MIRVTFDPSRLEGDASDAFAEWSASAVRGTTELREAVAARRPLVFKAAIWRDLKRILLEEVFHGKCAYCEGSISAYSPLHADHWRPKGEVTVRGRDGSLEEVRNGDGELHPGYWWLAYEWSNFLPSCHSCNSARGKGSQFPIAGRRAWRETDAPTMEGLDDREKPLLLHPSRGPDPADHLYVNRDGQIEALPGSSLAGESIRVYDLNRQGLKAARLRLVGEASRLVLAVVTRAITTNQPVDLDAVDAELPPDTPHRLALRCHVENVIESVLRPLLTNDPNKGPEA